MITVRMMSHFFLLYPKKEVSENEKKTGTCTNNNNYNWNIHSILVNH